MKLIAAAIIALCAATAHAEVMMFTPNTEGGLIEFTDQPCPTEGFAAVIVSAGGQILEVGCWKWEEPNVTVRWDSTGDLLYYNPANIFMTKAGKKRSAPPKATRPML